MKFITIEKKRFFSAQCALCAPNVSISDPCSTVFFSFLSFFLYFSFYSFLVCLTIIICIQFFLLFYLLLNVCICFHFETIFLFLLFFLFLFLIQRRRYEKSLMAFMSVCTTIFFFKAKRT